MTNQEAIDYIGTIHVQMFNDGKYKCAEACEMAIDALQVQDKQRWIPCSERLPEDVEEGQEYPTVIFCTKSGEVATGWYEILTKTWWRESASDDVIYDKVIAWKPMPDPYEEEDDDE